MYFNLLKYSYEIYYYNRQRVEPLSIEGYTYSAIPKCFGLLDTADLEESGVIKLQNLSTLSLRGQGVLVGFVDTGIAYENDCFRYSDGSTRIRAIWDQTATPEENEMLPEGFAYGVEYSREQIDEALRTEDPRALVPQWDEDGHGTALASIACGSEDPSADFTGAAPLSDILVVKLKPAKPYLKDFFYIPEDQLVFQENDIMAAVAYLEKKAEEFGQPLVICVGLGTNNGSHSGASVLSEYLNYIGQTYTQIPFVPTTGYFGALTYNAVEAFQNLFEPEEVNGEVDSATWNAIIRIYEDLYNGNQVSAGQFPGNTVS